MTLRHFLRYKLLAASLILLLSCAPKEKFTLIQIEPFYGANSINCDLSFQHDQQKWKIDTLGLFMSSFSLSTPNKKMSSVDLVTSNWQTKDSALLWFNPCAKPNKTTANYENEQAINFGHNHQVALKLDSTALETANTLTFSLAVPYSDNHANPLTQEPPLNNPNMFWSWQTGHKFLRFDIKQDNGASSWAFHLGSIGCSSKSSMRAPSGECALPNRKSFSVDIPKQNIAPAGKRILVIKVDLAAMLNNINLVKSKPCMFAVEQQESCMQLMQNLANENVFTALWKPN